MFRIHKGAPQRLLVALLSDLLLITRETQDKQLLLVEEPLPVEHLNIDWERSNGEYIEKKKNIQFLYLRSRFSDAFHNKLEM